MSAVGCYVGCTPPTTVPSGITPHITSGAAPVAHFVGGLPFTGLDVTELLAVGLGLIVTSVLLTLKLKKDESAA